MSFQKNIKKLSGIFITCLFLLSITPRQYVHYLFAHHHDSIEKVVRTHNTSLSVGGYNCNVDQLVAESNFENDTVKDQIFIGFLPKGSVTYKSHLYFTQIENLKDRGPPHEL